MRRPPDQIVWLKPAGGRAVAGVVAIDLPPWVEPIRLAAWAGLHLEELIYIAGERYRVKHQAQPARDLVAIELQGCADWLRSLAEWDTR